MKKIIGIVVIIVVLMLGLVAWGIMPVEPESEGTVFGDWGTSVIITYEDGSTENLRALMDPSVSQQIAQALSLYRDDKVVSSFEYIISARATAVGYEHAYFKDDAWKLVFKARDSGNVVQKTLTKSTPIGTDLKRIPTDGEWHELATYSVTAVQLGFNDADYGSCLPFGFYQILVSCEGQVYYQGENPYEMDENAEYPSNWVVLSNPTYKYIDVDWKMNKELNVELSTDYSASAGTHFEQQLSSGSNNVVFPSGVIPSSGMTPEAAFSSIISKVDIVWHYDGAWTSWAPAAGGDLTRIYSGETYRVDVSSSCTLTLN